MSRHFPTYDAALAFANALFSQKGIIAGIYRKSATHWIVG